ncbi:hypothetical protein SK128_005246 [Halocaridina rubra]|uniref:Uncharacterized protein n=1 Tax=Halocaridina rubra TaxID=373956 RepID=A0AAN8XB04_HALRR
MNYWQQLSIGLGSALLAALATAVLFWFCCSTKYRGGKRNATFQQRHQGQQGEAPVFQHNLQNLQPREITSVDRPPHIHLPTLSTPPLPPICTLKLPACAPTEENCRSATSSGNEEYYEMNPIQGIKPPKSFGEGLK